MSSRLRNQGSTKISFFAFQDIITSVSGILILVTLLLATELGRPLNDAEGNSSTETGKKLEQILNELSELDANNSRLQASLSEAETGPSAQKLEADVASLNTQLLEAREKQARMHGELTTSKAALADKDRILGLTALQSTIDQLARSNAMTADRQKLAMSEKQGLESRLSVAQKRLEQLNSRKGQLWLIPDKNGNSKEPVLVTVGKSGVSVDYFNQQGKHKGFSRQNPEADFEQFVSSVDKSNQYIVFLVRPSGIGQFKQMQIYSRAHEIDIGYDALAEAQDVHFSSPPKLDEVPIEQPERTGPSSSPGEARGTNMEDRAASAGGVPGGNVTPPAKPPPAQSTISTNATGKQTEQPAAPPPPPRKLSWWERLLRWIGIK